MDYEYATVITYGKTTEVRRYQKRPLGNTRARSPKKAPHLSHILQGGENEQGEIQSTQVRSKENARRAYVAFRRIVLANLGRADPPVLASFTYRENMADLQRGRKDFNTFTRALKSTFGGQVRYIAVCEFQERGAVHFHSLIWGLPFGTVKNERSTRLVATLWSQGFADLVSTDGDEKLGSYLAKYFGKTFTDPRLLGKKSYITSRNIRRPHIDKDAILAKYFHPENDPNLSTSLLEEEREYETMYFGRANFKKYKNT